MEFDNKELYVPKLALNRGEEESRKLLPKLLHIVFCVDVSINMKKDNRISAVNDVISEVVYKIRDHQADVVDEYDIRISVITFDKNAEVKVVSTPVMDLLFVDLECSYDSCCNAGSAFMMLNEKLTRRDWFNTAGRVVQPIIMLITGIDQLPEKNWEQDLELLCENGWFKASQREAVLVGERIDCSEEARKLVEKFVSNPDDAIFNIESVGPSLVDAVKSMMNFRCYRPTVGIRHDVPEEIGKADINDLLPGWDDGWGFDWDGFDSNSIWDSNDQFFKTHTWEEHKHAGTQ